MVCEGPSGFKFTGESGRYGTVYNYGAIITSAFTAAGKARSFHNEGSVMLGYTVNARSGQAFRDGDLTIASGRAAVTGLKTGTYYFKVVAVRKLDSGNFKSAASAIRKATVK